MSRLLGFLFILMLAPTLVCGQRTKSVKPVPGTPQEYALLKNQNDIIGKLVNVDTASSGNKTFSLDIAYQYAVAKSTGSGTVNPITGRVGRQTNYQSQLAALQLQYQQAMNITKPAQRQKRLAQIAARMAQLQAQIGGQQAQLDQLMLAQAARVFGNVAKSAPSIAVGLKEFDMEAIDKAVVRRQNPPVEYDSKGNLKKYSRDELDRLRGKDKTLPGYEATFLDLQNGQFVKAYLSKSQPAKKEKKDDKNADPPEDAAKPDKAKKPALNTTVDLPQVRLILILSDPNEGDGQDQPGVRKKNQ